LVSGVLSLGSLSSAVPEVISDLANALDAAGVVTRNFSTPPLVSRLPTNVQRPLPTARFSEPTFLWSYRNCSRQLSRPQLRQVSRKQSAMPTVLLESPVRLKLHHLNRSFCRTLLLCFWMDLHPVTWKL
jgi:hypothetical protein